MPNGGGVQIPDKMFPVTEAPASRQIRAAARSNPMPRARSVPDLGQAALWSPNGSTGRWHRQRAGIKGNGRGAWWYLEPRTCEEGSDVLQALDGW